MYDSLPLSLPCWIDFAQLCFNFCQSEVFSSILEDTLFSHILTKTKPITRNMEEIIKWLRENEMLYNTDKKNTSYDEYAKLSVIVIS